ncbi:MAG TPA: phosphatidylglycerophosphatase A [candidate division Zixibacteria bacterium]|nr:phosphatidylglycerophosphatase A [candidate division Zixibacteria bacterium]
MKDHIIRALATGFYSGYSPVVAGTVGSIPPLALAYFFIEGAVATLAVVAALTTLVSIWAAGEGERLFGHDSKMIVSDEWAGMFITLLFVPHDPLNYLIAFICFRVFDVVKVWPAGAAERLPGGWGVTMDDVVAGIQANLATQLIIWGLTTVGATVALR